MSPNAQVEEALQRASRREHSASGYAVDGYEVRAHPDLVDRLRDLMTYCPGSSFKYVFGTPTLSTAAGEIFATAFGTSSLCLRLPGISEWGRSYAEYGDAWKQGSAWILGRPPTKDDEEKLRRFVTAAYASALERVGG
jgi:hypothetical protein